MKFDKKKVTSKKIIGYVLFLLFGLGTWLTLNGIWIELPLLIPQSSEGWALAPQLGMISNIANIGPLIIALIHYITGDSFSYEVPAIYVIFSIDIIVPLILAFTWFKQVYFLGKTRSIYLLIFSFCLALANCTTSVTKLPFVNRFDHKWLNIYFAGEALSSLIPAILGLLQGAGQQAECVFESFNSTKLTATYFPSRFTVQVYFICLSIIMLISFLAFLVLWNDQRKKNNKSEAEKVLTEKNDQSPLLLINSDEITVPIEAKKNEEKLTFRAIMYLLIILWTSILLLGCIPSIVSYSLNPYGILTFHYVLIFCQFCYPLISLIATLFPKLLKVSTIGIVILTIAGTLAFCYISVTVFKSPCSPLVDHWTGKYLVAMMWLFIYLIFYFERIALGNYFNDTSGHQGLFWYGLLTQAGAFTGASVVFILSYFNVFKERDPCTIYQCD